MTDRVDTWRRAAELFDELADLPAAARRQRLAGADLPEAVREWVVRMLEAHDGEHSVLIDREVSELAREMIAGHVGDSERPDFSGQRFGPWQADEEIGRGGMGVVYRGRRADGAFEMTVAIKVIDPALVETESVRFTQGELRMLARLQHPGIARLLDGGRRDDGAAFVVMEFVDGLPVDEYCRRNRSGLRRRVAIARRLTQTVAWCHRRLVIHGDIKPSNVMVASDGNIKLLDFGIAARSPGADGESTPDRRRWCSPGYCAPERFRGAQPSAAEDIFALGALLYQLLTGSPIRDATELTRWLVEEKTPRAPEPPSQRVGDRGHPSGEARSLAGDLDAICQRALHDDPDQRYSSADAMAGDLDAWLERRPVAARKGGRAYRFGRWMARNRWLASASALGFAGMALGLLVALWQADRARQAQLEAERALAETQLALERVTTLRDFMVDLFGIADPGRARDAPPTIDRILSAGAERALEGEVLAPGERFELLLALGEVHRELNRRDTAERLLAAAEELARGRDDIGSGSLAAVLSERAWLAGMNRDMEGALARLQEAREHAAASGDPDRALQIAGEFGFLLLVEGRHAEALEVLRAADARLESTPGLSQETVFGVKNPLAIALKQTGRLQAASQAYRVAADAADEHWGPGSQRAAMVRANIGGIDFRRGALTAAGEAFSGAIRRYRELHDGEPTEYEAAASTNLARVELALGRFDRALETMDAANRMWSQLRGTSPGQSPMLALEGGVVLYRSRRLTAAGARFEAALERFERHEADFDPALMTRGMVLLAALRCRSDEAEAGRELLERAARRIEAEPFDIPEYRAEHHEAAAWCARAQGRADDALSATRRALELLENGWLIQHTELRLLASELLRALGREAAADDELDIAVKRFETLGLRPDHPARRWVADRSH